MPRAFPTAQEIKPARTPFYDDGVLRILVHVNEQQKFTAFECTYKGETKVFPVTGKIVDAWKEYEKWFNSKI